MVSCLNSFVFAFIFLIAVTSGSASGQASEPAGLLAHYPFNTDILDASGNGNHGTAGQVSFIPDRFENSGSAVVFDETISRIIVPDSESLNPSDQITITAWIKPGNLSARQYQNIVRKNGIYSGYLLAFQEFGTRLTMGINTDSAQECDGVLTPDQIRALETGWHFVAGTYDGKIFKVYLDGRMVGFRAHQSLVNKSANFLILGGGASPYENFTGGLDEVRIYDRALTQAELTPPRLDINQDSRYDHMDVAAFAGNFGRTRCSQESECAGEATLDQDVDGQDLVLFMTDFKRHFFTSEQADKVYAITDLKVSNFDKNVWYPVGCLQGYTGVARYQCTEPYVPGETGNCVSASDVNANIGGTTTGIWAQYQSLDRSSPQDVLAEVAVAHWPNWVENCPEGFSPVGKLTTRTDGECLRMGLCARFAPLNETETFISALSFDLSACGANTEIWPMSEDTRSIQDRCGSELKLKFNREPAVSIPDPPSSINLSDTVKLQLMEKYAPLVHLHPEDTSGYGFAPDDVERSFQFLERFAMTPGICSDCYAQCPGCYWLKTIESLPEPDSSHLTAFDGNIDLSLVPVYAYWAEKNIPLGDKLEVVADLVYFVYFPYNRGKQVLGTTFGHHVGDWEHITIRLTWQYEVDEVWALKPSQIYLSAHNFGQAKYWDSADKYASTDHPVVYSAKGSHGFWFYPGTMTYKDLGWIGSLADNMAVNLNPWQTWQFINAYDFNTRKGIGGTEWPLWMNTEFTEPGSNPSNPLSGPIFRWGNNYQVGTIASEISGENQLENGPTGPVSKECLKSLPLQ